MTQSPYPAYDFPADPQPNQIVHNDITGMRYQWRADLGRWVILGDDIGVQLYIQDEPPIGAPEKSLWYDSVRAELKIRYEDGDSIQWVPVSCRAQLIGLRPTRSSCRTSRPTSSMIT